MPCIPGTSFSSPCGALALPVLQLRLALAWQHNGHRVVRGVRMLRSVYVLGERGRVGIGNNTLLCSCATGAAAVLQLGTTIVQRILGLCHWCPWHENDLDSARWAQRARS